MNFRVNSIVALAAVFSFACADKQAAIPELEEALVAPPGMKVVGLYRMDVTPVETPSGVQFAFQPIPVDRNGNAATNPPNTVQVAGTFGQVTTAGPGGCAGISALTAAVEITNFMVDPLRNVWVDVIDMSGNTGNTACNSTSVLLSEGFFPVAQASQGLWKYNDLAGAPTATGLNAGGASLPLGGVWGFRRVTLTPFQFYFRVVADDQSPVLTFRDPAGPNAPISWTSAVAANTNLEICRLQPGLGNKGDPCPVALTVNQPVAGTGVGPWTYSYAPTGLTPGATYYWRARNVFPAGTSTLVSDWFFFTYNGALPVVANATFAANLPATFGATAPLTWTTIAAQTDTWMVLCAGPCPATRPAVPGANILFDAAVAWDNFPGALSNYSVDALAPPPLLAADLATGVYLDTTAVYDWRVYDYDGFSPPPAYGAAHSTGTITITPVATAPVIATPGTQLAPAVYTLAGVAPWTVTWTTSAPTIDVVYEVLDLNDPIGLPIFTSAVIPGVLNGVSGLYDYSQDLRLVAAPFGAGNYLLTVYNSDLAGVFGATHYFDVN